MVVSELVIASLQESIGLSLVFWNNQRFRFSGKLIACDGIYIKYFDDHQLRERLFKIADMEDVQIK